MGKAMQDRQYPRAKHAGRPLKKRTGKGIAGQSNPNIGGGRASDKPTAPAPRGFRERSSGHFPEPRGTSYFQRSRSEKDSRGPADSERETSPLISDHQITDGRFIGRHLPESNLAYIAPAPREVRGSIFRILGRRVSSSRFLDLCAGTGFMGIEAISRGAKLASFVEQKARRCTVIKNYLNELGIREGHGEILNMESAAFLKLMTKRRRFWDLVYYGPPFDTDYDGTLEYIGRGAVLRPKGVLVISHHAEMFFPETMGVLKRRKVFVMGDQAVSFYDRKA